MKNSVLSLSAFLRKVLSVCESSMHKGRYFKVIGDGMCASRWQSDLDQEALAAFCNSLYPAIDALPSGLEFGSSPGPLAHIQIHFPTSRLALGS